MVDSKRQMTDDEVTTEGQWMMDNLSEGWTLEARRTAGNRRKVNDQWQTTFWRGRPGRPEGWQAADRRKMVNGEQHSRGADPEAIDDDGRWMTDDGRMIDSEATMDKQQATDNR